MHVALYAFYPVNTRIKVNKKVLPIILLSLAASSTLEIESDACINVDLIQEQLLAKCCAGTCRIDEEHK
jgi:hypothetical protein